MTLYQLRHQGILAVTDGSHWPRQELASVTQPQPTVIDALILRRDHCHALAT